MNLTVLRPANGNMMYLVKYDVTGTDSEVPGAEIIHNHELAGATVSNG